MEAAVRRRLRAPQRREHILAAALGAFAERGYRGASMREVADAAGITKPVIYDHFGSKQALYAELMTGIRDDLVSRSAGAMSLDAPLPARIRTAIDAFWAYVAERPAAVQVLFVIPRGEPDLRPQWDRVQAEVTETIAGMLVSEPGLLAGEPDREVRLELFTEFLKKGMHGLAEWWIRHPEVPRETIVDVVFDSVWSGLGSRYSRQSGQRNDVA
jgi:AcrR family transcriptional regulator